MAKHCRNNMAQHCGIYVAPHCGNDMASCHGNDIALHFGNYVVPCRGNDMAHVAEMIWTHIVENVWTHVLEMIALSWSKESKRGCDCLVDLISCHCVYERNFNSFLGDIFTNKRLSTQQGTKLFSRTGTTCSRRKHISEGVNHFQSVQGVAELTCSRSRS